MQGMALHVVMVVVVMCVRVVVVMMMCVVVRKVMMICACGGVRV